jgi:ABC-2 type transport system ATP-binding protein
VTPAPAIPALRVEGLVHEFGPKRALDGVAFAIRPGDFTVLLGLNGAGKTTLYSLITRLYNNRSGSIRIFGFDVRKQPSRALARIGVVFQQPTLDLDLTVEQNLHYHAALHGISRSEARARIEVELKRADLIDRIHDKVRALSGGQRRRIELARALLHRPQLLLLDEPTVGLDIGSRQAIVSHVRRLCKEDRLAVLWATHLIDEVDEGDQMIVLHQGRVLAAGSVPEVVRRAGAAHVREAFTSLIAKA